MKTFYEFEQEVKSKIKTRPSWSRKGQFVFNYIDEHYGVARDVQFLDNIDCFYDDEEIDAFIVASYLRLIKNKE